VTLNRHVVSRTASRRLRDVTRSASDDAQTLRDKRARIVLDELSQFVGVLDRQGVGGAGRIGHGRAGRDLDWVVTGRIRHQQGDVAAGADRRLCA
jgi:hypothetical protein